MRMIKEFMLGSIANNCFLIESNGKIILIDAPEGSEKIVDFLNEKELTLDYVFLTHAHFDHFLGLETIISAFSDAKVYINKKEQNFLKDINENLSIYATPYVYPGVVYNFDDIDYQALDMDIFEISGHSKASNVFYFKAAMIAFSGDTLFATTIGRSDLPYGDQASLVSGIKQHLMSLDDETKVYPGHGPSTTIKKEKVVNPYMK